MATATAIADREELSALTMRRLSQELGVSTMTVYGYFANKDAILDAVMDSIMGDFVVPRLQAQSTPRSIFIDTAHSVYALLHEHPSVARLLTMRVNRSRSAVHAAFENVLARFVEAGMTETAAVQAYGAMMQYTIGFVLYQIPRGHGRFAAETGRDVVGSEYYQALGADEFPVMTAMADILPSLPERTLYDAVITALAGGLGLGFAADAAQRAS